MASKSIMFVGVGIHGISSMKTIPKVEMALRSDDLKDKGFSSTESIVVHTNVPCSSEKIIDVKLEKPICIVPNTKYTVCVKIAAPFKQYYRDDIVDKVEANGVSFQFSDKHVCSFTGAHRTSNKKHKIPRLIFKTV